MIRRAYTSGPIHLAESFLPSHTTSDKIKLAQLTSSLFYIITADILNTETLSERTFSSTLPSSPPRVNIRCHLGVSPSVKLPQQP